PAPLGDAGHGGQANAVPQRELRPADQHRHADRGGAVHSPRGSGPAPLRHRPLLTQGERPAYAAQATKLTVNGRSLCCAPVRAAQPWERTPETRWQAGRLPRFERRKLFENSYLWRWTQPANHPSKLAGWQAGCPHPVYVARAIAIAQPW